MSIWLTNLADVLRAAGLPVVEMPGWQAAAYPKYGGFIEPPSHVMVHHTASNPGTDPHGDLNYIINSHPLRPICQLYLSRSGTFYVVAAGRCCTNGAGSSAPWNGGVPDGQMNHHAIAIEAANQGTGERWPDAQIHSYVHGVAALCKAYNIPNKHVRAHHEWAPGRKIDPAGQSPYAVGSAKWDMNKFRADVAAVATGPTTPQEPEMQYLDPPHRIDTRVSGVPLKANVPQRFAVMMGGSAVLLNITAIPLNPNNGYVVAYNDTHDTPPNNSNVNFSGGKVIANLALVPTNQGWIKVMASQDCHLILDTQGFTA